MLAEQEKNKTEQGKNSKNDNLLAINAILRAILH